MQNTVGKNLEKRKIIIMVNFSICCCAWSIKKIPLYFYCTLFNYENLYIANPIDYILHAVHINTNNIPENTSNGACMYLHTVIPYEIDKMA